MTQPHRVALAEIGWQVDGFKDFPADRIHLVELLLQVMEFYSISET